MTRRSFICGSLALALRRERLDEALRLIQTKIDSGEVHAAVLRVRQGKQVLDRNFGAANTPDAVFLLASITKPMTASAVMILSDENRLSIGDPVQKYIPEFRGAGKDRVLIRHLLTHTSGMPDMLPDNDELRKRHAPLTDFVTGACATPLLFSPGTKVKYQSMGVLLAAEIVQRITRRPLPEFLRDRLFRLLDMNDTSLGLGGHRISDTMQCQVPEHTDWDWNSTYWRNLGAPWGGAHSTAADVSRFLEYFLQPSPAVLKPATAAAMITDQNRGLNLPWGLGSEVGHSFGKSCSARTFGHGGSTGTLAWLDPEKDLSFVLLTTEPAALSQKTLLGPVSDIISDSI